MRYLNTLSGKQIPFANTESNLSAAIEDMKRGLIYQFSLIQIKLLFQGNF